MRYVFADCMLDTDSYTLTRGGEPIPVEPQVFDLLQLLAENAGRLVHKDTLIEAIWQGRIVSEATVSARINAARAAVGDNGKDQRVIRTAQRRGFEMVAEVRIEDGSPSVKSSPKPGQTIRYTKSGDGTGIAYAVSGVGRPLLRAGHFMTHLEHDWQDAAFSPYIHALSTAHRLVRYDMRGSGLSQTNVSDLSIAAYAADMLAVADAVGLDRFPVFAISQGVPVAIHLAAHHPDRVSRMVLYGGFAQGRMVRDDAAFTEEAEAMLTLIRSGWGQPGSAFMSAFTSIFCPEASREERDSLVRTQLASATPEMAVRIRQAIDRFDVTDCLSRVEAPVLIIHASNDAVNPLSQGRLLAQSIPGAEFRQVESNNHIFLKSSPVWQEIMSASLDFLALD